MLFRTSIAVAGISGICLLAVGLNDRLSVRASHRILLIEPAARVVVAMIPRYKLLP